MDPDDGIYENDNYDPFVRDSRLRGDAGITANPAPPINKRMAAASFNVDTGKKKTNSQQRSQFTLFNVQTKVITGIIVFLLLSSLLVSVTSLVKVMQLCKAADVEKTMKLGLMDCQAGLIAANIANMSEQIRNTEKNLQKLQSDMHIQIVSRIGDIETTSRIEIRNSQSDLKKEVVGIINEIMNTQLMKFQTSISAVALLLRPASCKNVSMAFSKTNNVTGGLFDINLPNIGYTEMYCDMTTDGGGWTVFQRRMDGSVDFNRNWVDYVKGFGKKQGEFWLGLETIHQLTKKGVHELRIDMIAVNGTKYYAKFSSFYLGNASTNYTIMASGYSGNDITEGYGRARHFSHRQFTTKDKDHDKWPDGNCASTPYIGEGGGWWYFNCGVYYLNAKFDKNLRTKFVWWEGSGGRYYDVHLRFTEMKFRQN